MHQLAEGTMTFNFREFRRGDLIVRLRWHERKGLLLYVSNALVELPNEADATNPVEAHLEAVGEVLNAELNQLDVEVSGLKAAKEVRRLIEFDFEALDAAGIQVSRVHHSEVKETRSWKKVLAEVHDSLIVLAGMALLLVSLAALLYEEIKQLLR
jgi:hypothetical protein